MAKTTSVNSSTPVSEDETQKMRKKQAKREAKAMLVVEDAKEAVQKAEKKLAKAQARLDARTARLQTLEANLTELRASLESPQESAPDAGFDHQSGQPEVEEETPAIMPTSSEHQEGQLQPEPDEKTEVSAPDAGFDHQSGQPEVEEETTSPDQEHILAGEEVSTPPAEEHEDIPSTSSKRRTTGRQTRTIKSD